MSNKTPKTFYCVWTKPSGLTDLSKLRPTSRTYDNIGQAQRKTERLAQEFPGRKFFIMQVVERVEGTENGLVRHTFR